jgi:hypothetical protein
MCVGLELTASGAAAVLSAVCGPEESSEAEALAHSPAVSAGKTRILDAVFKNTAGTVEDTALNRDRRPWARGAHASAKRTSGDISIVSGAQVISGLTLRVECAGVPVRLEFQGTVDFSGTESLGLGFLIDGSHVDSTAGGTEKIEVAGKADLPFNVAYSFAPAVGSHAFQAVVTGAGTAALVLSSVEHPLRLLVTEDVRPFANNGTA